MATDLFGYRNDSGGGGSLESQYRRILSDKPIYLNSAGRLIEQRFYYDINNSQVDPVESQTQFGKDRTPFNQKYMGSSPSVTLQQINFAGMGFIRYMLQDVAWDEAQGGNGGKGIYIPHGWAFEAQETFTLYMGAASISSIEWSTKANRYAALAQCQTFSKKQALIDGAGYCISANKSGSHNIAELKKDLKVFRPKNGPGGNDRNIPSEDALRTGLCPVKMPWSSLVTDTPRLPFDLSLMNQPIVLQVKLRKGTDLITYDGCEDVIKEQFAEMDYVMWTEELANKAIGVKQTIMRNPELNITLPFQLIQQYPVTVRDSNVVGAGSDSGQSGQRFKINLTNLLNADLTSIGIVCTWEGDELGTAAIKQDSVQAQKYEVFGVPSVADGQTVKVEAIADVSTKCPLFGRRLINPILTLNSQRFHDYPEGTYETAWLCKGEETNHYILDFPYVSKDAASIGAFNEMSINSVASKTNPQANTYNYTIQSPAISYQYMFLMCPHNPLKNESYFQNTARFTNQSFQLEFGIDRSNGWAPDVSFLHRKNFNIEVIYTYNALLQVGSHGGTTTLYTN